jgi:hypothetical protein
MRVLLIGMPADRARLRAELDGSIVVVGEFASLASAQASNIDADAAIVAADAGRSRKTMHLSMSR